MRRQRKQYLDFAEWPIVDKTLWKAAFEPGTDLFDEGGSGGHLAERTLWQLRYTYGKFLYFVFSEHRELLKRAPADRINARVVEKFVKWQPARCGGITISIYLYHLWLALRYLCPRDDWAWLMTVSNRIKSSAKAKPQQHHLVTSERLYDVGIKLMDGALSSGKPPTSWRVQTAFRDGLIIALLALIPLRRRTLAALHIGKHLVRSGDHWALDIPAVDVKTKRSLDYPLSPELSQRIDVYVNEIRSRTAGAATHDYLWASSRGRPMGASAINNTVRRRTRRALGFSINLHRFRRAAATLWSVQDPANVLGSKDLLGHASFATTEKYYIMAQSRLAGRALARAIDGLQSDGAAVRVLSGNIKRDSMSFPTSVPTCSNFRSIPRAISSACSIAARCRVAPKSASSSLTAAARYRCSPAASISLATNTRDLADRIPRGIPYELGRLFTDTAGTTSATSINAALGVMPKSNLLYGSDFPYLPIASANSGLAQAKLPLTCCVQSSATMR